MVVLSLSQLMLVLDATIVNIAVPAAQQSLGFGNDQRQWVVIAYALAFGSLLILGGRIGRKTAYIVGPIAFLTGAGILAATALLMAFLLPVRRTGDHGGPATGDPENLWHRSRLIHLRPSHHTTRKKTPCG